MRGFGLDGRVAIVTGGAMGIGTGITQLLAEAGATVVIADHAIDAARAEAARLSGEGHRADAVTLDVADPASIVACCADVVAPHRAMTTRPHGPLGRALSGDRPHRAGSRSASPRR